MVVSTVYEREIGYAGLMRALHYQLCAALINLSFLKVCSQYGATVLRVGLFLDVNFKQFWNQTSYTENGFDLVIYMDERFFGVSMYLVLGMTAFLRLEVINLTMLTSYFIIIIIIIIIIILFLLLFLLK